MRNRLAFFLLIFLSLSLSLPLSQFKLVVYDFQPGFIPFPSHVVDSVHKHLVDLISADC